MGSSEEPVDQECVEGYVFATTPQKLLILQRPVARGSVWVPVSGKVEPTDVTFEAALRRELAEETGFTKFARLFPLDWSVRFDGPNEGRWRLHGFGVELAGEAPPRLSDEHVAFEWVTFEAAKERLHYADNKEAVHVLARTISGGGSESTRSSRVRAETARAGP